MNKDNFEQQKILKARHREVDEKIDTLEESKFTTGFGQKVLSSI